MIITAMSSTRTTSTTTLACHLGVARRLGDSGTILVLLVTLLLMMQRTSTIHDLNRERKETKRN